MNEGLGLEYDRLLGEGAYGKVFLVKQQDGQQVFVYFWTSPTPLVPIHCIDQNFKTFLFQPSVITKRLITLTYSLTWRRQ